MAEDAGSAAAPGAWPALVRAEFVRLKRLAEAAIQQVADEDLRREPGPGSNAIATIAKHQAGNLRSRFTEFLTTDGEKPWRDRDREFMDEGGDRAALLADWESGWAALFEALDALGPADLARTVRIRGEAHTVPQALVRQLSHHAYHVGQIVYVARLLCGERWRSLSVPPGASAAFNADMARRHGAF